MKHILAIIAIGILIVGGYLYISSNEAIVSAQGSSVIEAKPDKLSVNFNIEAKGKTAQEAKDTHDKILNSLTTKLLLLDVEKKDIKTLNFNLYPNYEWSNGENKLKGYIARQDITIDVKDFNQVAEIIDAGIDAGSFVSYINFELSEEKQNDYKVQALQKAGEDAKRKAEATASGLGKKIGRLVSVQSEEFNYLPYRYFDSGGAIAETANVQAKQAAVNLVPRDIEVSASLRVEYKLSSF